MTPETIETLARTYTGSLKAAQDARRSQHLELLSLAIKTAATAWRAAQALSASLQELKVDLSPVRGEVAALREAALPIVQELVLAPEDHLVTKPANVLAGTPEKNAARITELLRSTWYRWTENEKTALTWLQPLLERISDLKGVAPKVTALVKEISGPPPTGLPEVARYQDWQKRKRDVLKRVDQVLDPNVADFLQSALEGGAWLDTLSATALEWLASHGLACYLKVAFSSSPNPSPATAAPPSEVDHGKSDDDWT